METSEHAVVAPGFDDPERDRIAALYWDAFRGKLGRIMRPESTALAFLARVVDPAYALVARDADGAVLGVAGFKTQDGAFVGGGLREFAQAYGAFSGLWRGLLLGALERPIEPDTLLMDGICVAAAARGQGVGSALLDAIRAEARSRACSQVRLDVIDSNPRARALYERHGFQAVGTESLGPLRHVFGFEAATAMVCRV